MTELISIIFGALSSGVFKWFPGLNSWFEARTPAFRGLFMLGLSLIAPVLIMGTSCLGLYDTTTCNVAGWQEAGRAWVGFLAANVGVFLTTPDSPAKVKAKALKFHNAVLQAVKEREELPEGLGDENS